MSVSIWSVLLGISALQGFFMTFVLARRNQGFKTANLWFGIILGVFSYSLLEYTLLLSGHIESVVHIFSVNVPLLFLLGPSLWFFARQDKRGKTVLNRRDFYHFAIALLVFFAFIPFYLLRAEVKLSILKALYQQGENLPFVVILFNLFFFVHLGFYGWQSLKKVSKQEGSKPWDQRIRKRVKYLSMSMLAFYLISVLSFTFFLFPIKWRLEVHYAFMLLFSFVIYGLSYRILFSQEELDFGKTSYQGKPEKGHEGLKGDLLRLLKEQKLYLDPELKLAALAGKMQLSSHELSRLINQSFDTNFASLINGMRVREAKRMLSENPGGKLLAVALDCGFSNQASFIRVFRQQEGMTPSEFRNSLRN